MYETKKYSKVILNKLSISRQSHTEKLYMFSQSYYNTEYTLSGYQFESFVSLSQVRKVQEAALPRR
jgi:hypothetical protein